jgi:hypothetical protein
MVAAKIVKSESHRKKIYTFPGKLSNFPHTREIREAAAGTEGNG